MFWNKKQPAPPAKPTSRVADAYPTVNPQRRAAKLLALLLVLVPATALLALLGDAPDASAQITCADGGEICIGIVCVPCEPWDGARADVAPRPCPDTSISIGIICFP
jgi:hypothetical protein